LSENTEMEGGYKSKWVFNVFLHKYFFNDYTEHIVETLLQISGQNIFQNIRDVDIFS